MTHIDRFSTEGLDPSDRVVYWNQLGTETYRDQIVVTPRPGATFNGELLRRSFDCMLITQVTTAPAIVRGEPWSAVERDAECAAVMIQDAGTTETVLNGRRMRLDPGMVGVNLRPHPYTIAFEETTRCIILRLPVARLAARLGAPSELVATAADAALLTGFLRTILAQQEPGYDGSAEEAISDVVLDLIALTFRRRPAMGTGPQAAPGERWQSTVREFVDRHLDDPELGASMIADRLGVTPRYVQMVFARMATTPSAYIIERRLERAARLLLTKRDQIGQIAFQVGFADLSHFYRSFRKRYGVSPGRYAAER